MTKQTRRWTFLVAAIAVFCTAIPLKAQVILDGNSAFDNLGKARGNASGNLISDGLLRATETARQGRSQVSAPRITETAPPQSIREQFFAGAAVTIVEQLNDTIIFLVTRLLARAGLIPDLSGDLQDFLDGLDDPPDTTDPPETTDPTDPTDPSRDGGRPPRGGRG